ncbi:ABC transporter permease [Kocuria sp.]|uniref:ABC transporter permease n=1 Tax=Kocuria sp. TaxID=1871328 RepID=UPI0026E0DED7|nr:ABC transporter permease [Kocuria sp.]MDO5617276.1 ABC transporter permease [Kocuria sp.]
MSTTLRYAAYDWRRQIRMVESLIFVVVLPTVLFWIFGLNADYATYPAGNGNVSGATATGMALYGAVIATTSIAGSAAVERSKGWGRLLALTPMRQWQYIVAKVLVACAIAAMPVALVFTIAALTNGELGSTANWWATGAIIVVGSAMFALYGLMFGLIFRTEGAVAAASGLLVVLAFFGNLFMPLSGTMLEIAKYTPLYGLRGLASWPQMEGALNSTDGTALTPDSMGLLIANVVVWTVIFAIIALLAARRGTQRK